MQIINKYNDCLGSDNFDAPGFESKEVLNREILKLIKIRSELLDNSEVMRN